jgi:thiol-disulfide isomerase/thioredoxin
MKRALRSLPRIGRAVSVTVFIGVLAIMVLHSARPVVATANANLVDEGPMPELDGAVAWLNCAPLNHESLRGKVVLVNFWTYSCINSLRELPYIRSWAAKYKDAGLIVIGVHTPEFGFEKERANVEHAVRELDVTYAVAIDSDRRIWQAFRNDYWPATYFIDGKGRIRNHHLGEGEYVKSEHVIQELLRENGATGLKASTVRPSADGAEAPPSVHVQSPESYVGYALGERFASPERVAQDSTERLRRRKGVSDELLGRREPLQPTALKRAPWATKTKALRADLQRPCCDRHRDTLEPRRSFDPGRLGSWLILALQILAEKTAAGGCGSESIP